MRHDEISSRQPHHPLNRLLDERDACGTGFVADISGRKSHQILETAITCVVNLTHRGAVAADAKTGDGAGVLTQLPEKFFVQEAARLGLRLDDPKQLAVGMLFLPPGRADDPRQVRCRQITEAAIVRNGLRLLGWRRVPVDPSALGEKAAATMPDIQQVLMVPTSPLGDEAYERALYLTCKAIERETQQEGITDCYIPSFSHRTIVYKGLFVAPQLRHFYLDLQDPAYETALALFHQRYSTNTFPNWPLAQPFRMLGHNGEINTLQGNRNWMRAREPELSSPVWGGAIEQLKPICWAEGSDSASLDNVLEALVLSDRNILHAMMMLVPEAWQNMPDMDPDLRAFYEYHACILEPWDGPAALSFTDGTIIGAALDRNGLRPARYVVTSDGIIIMASEVGVVELDEATVIQKGQLGPGKMIAADTGRGILLTDEMIKREMAARRPYRQWLGRHLLWIEAPESKEERPAPDAADLIRSHRAFGYTTEELQMVLKPMLTLGQDAIFSMGDDAPLAVLSTRPRGLAGYFKQLFAQVTNPPIDPFREKLVMSLNTALGWRGSFLEEHESFARLIKFSSPILLDHQVKYIRELTDPRFSSVTLPALFETAAGPDGLEPALEQLCQAACDAVDRGHTILVLSDRGVDAEHAPIPMILAVAAVHHHLIRQGRRMKANLVVETGQACDIHHFATLIGYGASCVYPYLISETVRAMKAAGELGNVTSDQAERNFKKAVDSGLLKIMSKMGISTISSYRGAQIFEAIGLEPSVITRYFTGTASRVGGIGLRELADDVLAGHRAAFIPGRIQLERGGLYTYRKDGEAHAFNPDMVHILQTAVEKGEYAQYQRYAVLVNTRPPLALRDLLDFVPSTPIPIEEVEPVEVILPRFTTSGMSHGALSREAHETLAIAMNRIGGWSGSGEGGEDPERYTPRPNGDNANSKVKQVASARFGVTPEYLASADEIEIKMAQGSKPGEGGQLPGHKVTAEIARIRHAQPGVTLISPPPHHDIYSIEDLAQLIWDLKQANPRARVSVKLVSEAGVGTIAAGVAKAYADSILISGYDGGTGASPLSSIKNAGSPWELGLTEAHQRLVQNGLRGRIRLRVDGGFKTGRDVVIAAILGAEEFTFGSIALAAEGCVMTRQCHLNTCPVGVATQDPDLRKKFPGTPEMVVHFMTFVAREVREILASLGARRLQDVIGRPELLQQVSRGPEKTTTKMARLDLNALLANPDPSGTQPRFHEQERNNRPEIPLDDLLLQDAKAPLEGRGKVRLAYPVRNIHRAVGTKLSGEIARRYGDRGLPDGTIEISLRGSAGQSLGAFLIRGVRIILTGEANDYVGKGMAGGEIVIRPPAEARYATHENAIIGNTVLYGATGGELFAAGIAGERFAVRNSGATAVIEGVGEHGCEYMTGGTVVVLGKTGRNFGAGMTGGVAYILDEIGEFPRRYNPELIKVERLTDSKEIETLHGLISRHLLLTQSARAQGITQQWSEILSRFWKVVPIAAPEPKAKAPVETAGASKPASGAAPAR